MYNPSLVEKCMIDAFDIVTITHRDATMVDFSKLTPMMKYYLPWERPNTMKIASKLKTESKKKTDVFIKLVDGFKYRLPKCFGIPCAWYCDDLAGVSSDKPEHSICLMAIKNGYKGYTTNVHLKSIVRESEDQTLKILDSVGYDRKNATDGLKYSDSSEYKVMDIEDLKLGLSKLT